MFELRRAPVAALLAPWAGTALASRGIAPPGFDDEPTLTHQDATSIAMATWGPDRIRRTSFPTTPIPPR